jgi:hypothetical protein
MRNKLQSFVVKNGYDYGYKLNSLISIIECEDIEKSEIEEIPTTVNCSYANRKKSIDEDAKDLIGYINGIHSLIPKSVNSNTENGRALLKIRGQLKYVHEKAKLVCAKMDNFENEMLNYANMYEESKKIISDFKKDKPNGKHIIRKILDYDKLEKAYNKLRGVITELSLKNFQLQQMTPCVGSTVYVKYTKKLCDDPHADQFKKTQYLRGVVTEISDKVIKVIITLNGKPTPVDFKYDDVYVTDNIRQILPKISNTKKIIKNRS